MQPAQSRQEMRGAYPGITDVKRALAAICGGNYLKQSVRGRGCVGLQAERPDIAQAIVRASGDEPRQDIAGHRFGALSLPGPRDARTARRMADLRGGEVKAPSRPRHLVSVDQWASRRRTVGGASGLTISKSLGRADCRRHRPVCHDRDWWRAFPDPTDAARRI